MITQDANLTKMLKTYWTAAYKLGRHEIDLTGQDLAVGRIKKLRQDLYNYRRKVRQLKLNPNYVTEWKQINSCRILLLTPTHLLIYKLPEVAYKCKTPHITIPTLTRAAPNGRRF